MCFWWSALNKLDVSYTKKPPKNKKKMYNVSRINKKAQPHKNFLIDSVSQV